MKKILFVLTASVLSFTALMAQNTLHMRVPPSKYYVDQWPSRYDTIDTLVCNFEFRVESHGIFHEAYKMFTVDSLTIYGVAAALEMEELGYWYHPDSYQDTALKNIYDYLCIYEAETNYLRPIREVMINMGIDTVSYYWDFDAYQSPSHYFSWHAFPVYERYFDAPVTVTDSFYIGRKFCAHRHADGFVATTPPIDLIELNDHLSDDQPFMPQCFFGSTNAVHPYDSTFGVWIYDVRNMGGNNNTNFIPLLFPILTPDSTTISDTTGIRNIAEKYTSVSPNPASERVKVVSSFAMSRIEAYDASGRMTYSNAASGNISTINVKEWPNGIYILKIYTPAGIATKKITVSR